MTAIELLSTLHTTQPAILFRLKQQFRVSERTIRNYIKLLNQDGQSNGFNILNERTSGYYLEIHDDTLFQSYLNSLRTMEEAGNRQDRMFKLMYLLLQQNTYISLQKVADVLVISRNTLLNDLDEFKELLETWHLSLDSKSHHGIKLVGEELYLRKAFSKFVIGYIEYTSMIRSYFDFAVTFDNQQISEYLMKQINAYGLSVTKQSFDSIIDHLKVLMYRTHTNNFILDIGELSEEKNTIYHNIARQLIHWLQEKYGIKIHEIEIEYLSFQIAGKTSADHIPSNVKDQLIAKMTSVITAVDHEFSTNFKDDIQFMDALLMHIYPLMSRVSYKMELDNPLIEEVNSRYANVFLVALRFVELWYEQSCMEMSRDEVGYLALHFAGHIERQKNDALGKIKRVLIISNVGRGYSLLLKEKFQSIYTNAVIEQVNFSDTEKINQQGANFILSTVHLEDKKIDAPVIYTKDIIDEVEIQRVKDLTLLKSMVGRDANTNQVVTDLFDPAYFKIIDSGEYLVELETMANQMVNTGIVDKGFTKLVLERELRFNTIYSNGIAGPHSMVPNAIIEKIGAIVVRTAMSYEKKDVKIIFLLNVFKGNLFLYREISHFLTAIIDDYKCIEKLQQSETFDEFIKKLKTVGY